MHRRSITNPYPAILAVIGRSARTFVSHAGDVIIGLLGGCGLALLIRLPLAVIADEISTQAIAAAQLLQVIHTILTM